jgi:hypothetical protein
VNADPDSYEYQRLQEASAEQGTQFHDEQGDAWERHAAGDKRDQAADREVSQAIAAEQAGEWDADGTYRRSAWGPA